jgi:hypothetical protein
MLHQLAVLVVGHCPLRDLREWCRLAFACTLGLLQVGLDFGQLPA